MLDHFGVTEKTWKDAIKQDLHFSESETPGYIGRAVVALASDPGMKSKSGGSYSTWGLAKEYGFKDLDGRQPDWGKYLKRHFPELMEGDEA
jgi:hypothetical protein